MAIGDKKPVVMVSDIVNDLTTGGAEAALSAEMGKVLNSGKYSLTRGTAVAANDDLNNYIVPGSYICQTTAVANTVLNCPVTTTGWSLQVEIVSGASSNYLHQTLRINNIVADVWKRRFHPTSGWGEWSRFATMDDLETELAKKPGYKILTLEGGLEIQRGCRYFKTADGIVTVVGEAMSTASNGGITGDNTLIATLPEGFRPDAEYSFPATWWFEGTSTTSATRKAGAAVFATNGTIKARIAPQDIAANTKGNFFFFATFRSAT